MKIDVKKCPICNQSNNCGNELGQSTCWCSKEIFPEAIFKQLTEEQLHKSCICKKCLDNFKKSRERAD
ncbi:cysteine-rich CWC family protein [Alkalihalobacterium elongatum]|uniref:cysteine-rich CWC family protein n=1 Tax=Alkalihalobacterium elongatum TaxID=2675466 RepID=UPI001C1F9114|nr:cysteine-rich CWC family protein [Alkalihalobacterium elongatum]